MSAGMGLRSLGPTLLAGADSGSLIEDLRPPYDEPTAEDSPPPEEFGIVTGPEGPPRPWMAPLLLGVGLVLLVSGVALVIAAVLLSSTLQSFDQICELIPHCHAGADVTQGWLGVGVVLIVVGALLVALGYRRYIARSSWDAEEG